jgi:hypothetical protein
MGGGVGAGVAAAVTGHTGREGAGPVWPGRRRIREAAVCTRSS